MATTTSHQGTRGSEPFSEPLYKVKLLAALRTGDPALIHPFLADISRRDPVDAANLAGAALHLAIRCSSYETVQLLLNHRSISPNAIHPPNSGTTPLHLAASLSRSDVVLLLLEQQDIDDTIKDNKGHTCYEVARGKDVQKIIRESRLLLEASYLSLLRSYILSSQSTPTPEALTSLLSNPRAKLLDLSQLDTSSGTTLLHEAAKRKDLRLVELAVRAGADVFVRDRRGRGVVDAGGKDERVKAFLRQFTNQDKTLIEVPSNEPVTLKGYLNKYTNVAHGYSPRWFVLKDGMLSYYRHQEDENLACRGSLSMKTARLKKSPGGDKLKLEIHSSAGQKWYMKANHPVELGRWISAIEKSIEWTKSAGIASPVMDGKVRGYLVEESDSGSVASKTSPPSFSGTPSLMYPRRSRQERRSPGPGHASSVDGDGPDETGDERDEARSISGDSFASASASSGADFPPHYNSFSLHTTSTSTQLDLTSQLLTALVLPPSSPPRLLEIKSALAESLALARGMVNDWAGMVKDREEWWEEKVKKERERAGIWEESLHVVVREGEELEEELRRTLRDRKKARGKGLPAEDLGGGTIKASSKTAPSFTEPTDPETPLADRKLAETPHTATSQFSTTSSKHVPPELKLQPMAPTAITVQSPSPADEHVSTVFVSAPPPPVVIAAAPAPIRKDSALPFNQPTGRKESVGSVSSKKDIKPPMPTRSDTAATVTIATPKATNSPAYARRNTKPEDSDEEDEFFDAIDNNTLPNLQISAPLTSKAMTFDEQPEESKHGEIYNAYIAPYEGYFKPRPRLPISHDNKPAAGLWAVLKGNIGKDLTRISFPVAFNEPTSMLQRMAEDMEFSECLDAAAAEIDPHKRIAFVAAFAMSNYSSTIGRIAKPFNPMLGETFEYARVDKHYRYVSEQVSHHPPASACYAESPYWNYYGEVDAQNKFMGKSFEIRPTGVAHVDLVFPAVKPDDAMKPGGFENMGRTKKEHYSWKKVTTNISGFIMGSPTIDHYGDMIVRNHRTGDTCILTFKPRGWRGRDAFEIKGQVKDADGQVVYEIAGRWNSQLVARAAALGDILPDVTVEPQQPEYVLLWRNTLKPTAPFNLTPFATTLNDNNPALMKVLAPTDCRRRPDQRAFEVGKYDLADTLKREQEDFQRATRKKREQGHLPPHKPRWFEAKTDGDTGERFWAPVRVPDGRLEFWVERERVWKSGGKAMWKEVDGIFIEVDEEDLSVG